jgi:cytochrome c5
LILKRIYLYFVIGTLALGYGISNPVLAQEDPQFLQANQAAADHRNLLNQYCVTCHNAQLKTAELMLDQAGLDAMHEDGDIWEKVIRKLRTRAMPPSGMPRPAQAQLDDVAAFLETELDRSAAADPDPGRPVVSRLNRTEFGNAIRDLLAVEMDIASLLPNDDSGYGFDTVGEALSVSPLLAETYIATARKISTRAIGNPQIQPYVADYEISRQLVQDNRVSEDLPFGTRGGIAVRHHFPLDGEYVIKVQLQRNNDNYIRGLGEPHRLDIREDGALLESFSVGGEHKGRSSPLYSFINKDYLGDPEQEAYEFSADDHLQLRFNAKAGTRMVGAAFLKQLFEPEGKDRPRQYYEELFSFKGGEPAVDKVFISGPYNAKGVGTTASRDKIFSCYPSRASEELSCAQQILSSLGREAYRQPVNDQDMETLLEFYGVGYDQDGFEEGIRTAIQGLLVSPKFLFRIEQEPENVAAGEPYRISDLDLASRLSFFIWSSIPDDELLDLAEAGNLSQPEVLGAQVSRMLSDPRSTQLVKNFTEQWLGLRKLDNYFPDPKVFPDYDDNLRQALIAETYLFAESIAREDRSLLDFLQADYTFVNERLARHYGIPGVIGSNFRRVSLPDGARKGLLGKASILTVTSYANRTAPTLRGKWILENILGTPPPPPPPNVPTLEEENSENGRTLTMRERMEKHRANPVCAVCHKRMDPLGFALDNFNAIGEWREYEDITPIDASGVLPDGTEFQGPSELTEILLNDSNQFLQTITEKLLMYALGRGLTYRDQPVVRDILKKSAENDHSWSAVILGIVNSMPFQMRRSHHDDI